VMTSLSVFLALCGMLLVISLKRYLELSIPRSLKAIFISIRILMVLFLILSFVEPVIKFQRLAPEKPEISVLVDASKSMNLFKPESTIMPILKTLLRKDRAELNDLSINFFLFGDTLRKFSSTTECKFSDNKSSAPDVSSKALRSSQHIIILSDANWIINNTLLNRFSERSVFYVPLQEIQSKPYLNISVPESKEISVDSNATFDIKTEGFVDKNVQISFTVFEQTKIIKVKRIVADSGTLNFSTKILLPKQTAGKHLFRIVAEIQSDTLLAECFYLNSILPLSFNYLSHNPSPSLDSRFFNLALQRHPEFIKNQNAQNTTDLLLLFSYDSHTTKIISQISKKGIVAFLGCSPCSVNTIPVSTDFQLIKQQRAYETPFNRLVINDIPPPSMTLSIVSPIKPIQQILSGAYTFNKHFDTVPILLTGNLNNNRYISLNAIGYWKWDFWPLSLSRGEEQPFLFSEYLIATIKEMILSKISSNFYAFPEVQTYDEDSTAFALSLPSELPVPTDIDIKVTVQSANSAYKQTSSCKLTSTGSKLQHTRIPPLNAGLYTYTCEFTTPQGNFHYSDSLIVKENPLELSVQSQNTPLLNQFAQVIRFSSDSSLIDFLHTLKTGQQLPLQDYFQITRSWMILAVLFILFTIEWVLRRKYDLD
jgi:hypothetical protein